VQCSFTSSRAIVNPDGLGVNPNLGAASKISRKGVPSHKTSDAVVDRRVLASVCALAVKAPTDIHIVNYGVYLDSRASYTPPVIFME
jgi:hypothetical protein